MKPMTLPVRKAALRAIRIKLQKVALELEEQEGHGHGPDEPVVLDLENLSRDLRHLGRAE